MTTGTSVAKMAVNDQISCLVLKVRRCRQIFVHTSREDAESLAFSPLTRVLWGLLSGRQCFCAVIVGEEGEQGKAFIACGL